MLSIMCLSLVRSLTGDCMTTLPVLFLLPSSQATGIMEMRQALEDKEDAKSLKQKTRERVRCGGLLLGIHV